MVGGIDKFRAYFKGHEDQYAVIGGAACDLLFDQAGVPFRATRDIDMVLCVEIVDASFGTALRKFLDDGGYQGRERSDGKKEFFRFHLPSDKSFPFMIELFSRRPGTLVLPDDAELTPIPVDNAVLSLSAILLEEGYYEALLAAKRQVNGVTIIDETLLIPFKSRAFLDLTGRADAGEKIDSKNIKKHRNDVFRLIQLLPGNAKIEIPGPIREDLRRFIEIIEDDQTLEPRSFGVRMTRADGITVLRAAYGLE